MLNVCLRLPLLLGGWADRRVWFWEPEQINSLQNKNKKIQNPELRTNTLESQIYRIYFILRYLTYLTPSQHKHCADLQVTSQFVSFNLGLNFPNMTWEWSTQLVQSTRMPSNKNVLPTLGTFQGTHIPAKREMENHPLKSAGWEGIRDRSPEGIQRLWVFEVEQIYEVWNRSKSREDCLETLPFFFNVIFFFGSFCERGDFWFSGHCCWWFKIDSIKASIWPQFRYCDWV